MNTHHEIAEISQEFVGIDDSLRADILNGSHEWLQSYITVVSEIDNRLSDKNPDRIISGLLIDELKYNKTQELQAAALTIHRAKDAHTRPDARDWKRIQGAIGHDWFYAALIVQVFGDRMPEACHTFLAKQVDDIKPFVRQVVTTNTPLDPQEMWHPVKSFQHALERIRERPELGVTQEDVNYAREQLLSIGKLNRH